MDVRRPLKFGDREHPVLYSAEALWIIEEASGAPFFEMLRKMQERRMSLRDSAIVIMAGLEGARRDDIRRAVKDADRVVWTLARVSELFSTVEGGMIGWVVTELVKLTEAIRVAMPSADGKKGAGDDPLAQPSTGNGTSSGASTQASPSGTPGA